MISILTPPAKIVTAENDIVLRASENDIATSVAITNRGLLRLEAFHLPGDTINLIYVGVEPSTKYVTITCKDVVTDPKTEYPARTTETMLAWGNKVKEMFLANTYVANNFILKNWIDENGFYNLAFEPYVKDGSVSIAFYNNTVSVDMSTQNSQYSLPVYHSFLAMFAQLFITENNGGVETLQRLSDSTVMSSVTYDNNKAIGKWNLKTYIKNNYKGHFTFPLDSQNVHNHYILDKYRANVFSKYGSPPVDQNNTFTEDFYVLDAKLNEEKIKELNSDGKDIATYLSETKQFLTSAPKEKITDIYAPEKLYFPFQTAYSDAKLQVKEYYTDDTSEIRTVETFSTDAYQVREFESGFQKIKLDDYTTPGLTPLKWEIWLETSSGEFISEIRTYIIDTTFQPRARYFLVQNDWGVYECFRSTGRVKKINDIKKTFFEKQLENPTQKDRNIEQIAESKILNFNLDTGWLPVNWQIYLSDMLFSSRDMFWLKANKLFAITVDKGKPTAQEDDVYINSFKLPLLASSISDTFYTNFSIPELPILGDFNGDFNNDFDITN